MKAKFTQKDYILYGRYYDKVLEFYKKELEMIEKSGKKTLWYYGAKKTFEHLKEESGNLTPYDVDNIVYVLLNQIEEKQEKKNKDANT